MTTANFVDFQNVWLAYNDELLAQNHYAVEDINLQVKQGEFIAIVGPSGCGKSTFMKLTTGLKRPSKGQIFVDGQPVTGPLKISGMAFQAPSLLPWRTTLDNVLLPLEIVEPFRSQFKQRKAEFAERARKSQAAINSASDPSNAASGSVAVLPLTVDSVLSPQRFRSSDSEAATPFAKLVVERQPSDPSFHALSPPPRLQSSSALRIVSPPAPPIPESTANVDAI
ncbi:MAG: ATP-binding cassette domain-containing protein, partial [Burkholderiales bacterium]